MLTNKKIGVLLGGTSAEREVSLRSGQAVYNALKTLGYNVEAIDVGPDVCEVLKKEKIEIAFIVLHGGAGEDGSIQGLLEVMGIPYTGSGVLASALAMDKAMAKKVFLQSDINVPMSATVYSVEEGFKALETLNLPVVIKPSREGSSIGVSIVKGKANIQDALLSALSFHGPAVIEEFIKGKEVQIGVLGGRALGGVEVRPSLEFYSYEAKYTPGLTQYILPPEIPKDAYEKAEDMAVRAHNALGCSGATRVDLIIDDKGSPYVLEVNTIPGMTATSLLPKIAGMAGLDFPALIEEILKDALGKKEAF